MGIDRRTNTATKTTVYLTVSASFSSF